MSRLQGTQAAVTVLPLPIYHPAETKQRSASNGVAVRAGVSSVEIDMDRQKVTVTGHVDRREVLRAARRTGRAAEFWPWPYDGEYYPFAIQYLVDDPMIGSYTPATPSPTSSATTRSPSSTRTTSTPAP